MKVRSMLTATVCVLLCFRSIAISLPQSAIASLAFEDTTMRKFVSLSPAPLPVKRAGFLSKLKNKLAALFLTCQSGYTSKASTKSTLGWVALSMVGLSIILLATTGGAFSGLLFLGGLLTGLVSLCMPKSEADKIAKKNSNKGAILALSIGIGLILAIAIIIIGAGVK